jgi:SAM-dependent methyltransferase
MNTFDFDKTSFDKLAPTYEEARPGYAEEVYDCIDSVRNFSRNSLILEVGAGSGIATKEIADRWHPGIVALEPGCNLRMLAAANLRNYDNVEILGTTFEDYKNDSLQFDALFSATAFHWIDPEVKYKKAFELLKDDGLLILYWNNYGIYNEMLAKTIEELYRKQGMKSDDKTVQERQTENIARRKKEIEDSGLFHIIRHNIFRNEIPYSTKRYQDLLKTFSDHSRNKAPNIDAFFNEVGRVIDENNGIIDVDIKVNLEIAVKT